MNTAQRAPYISMVREAVKASQLVLREGEPVSKSERKQISLALEAWFYLSCDLMREQHLSLELMQEVLLSLGNALRGPIGDVVSFFDEVYLSLVSRETDGSYQAFKRLVDPYSSWLSSWAWFTDSPGNILQYCPLLGPIWRPIASSFRSRDSQSVALYLRDCAHYLRFLKKLHFESIGLEEKALEAYKELERNLETVDYDAQEEVIQDLSRIVHRWLRDFHVDVLLPLHGPGSVAEGNLTLTEKYRALGIDDMLRMCLRNHSFPDSWKDFFPFSPGSVDRCSRTIFVPKTISKLRTISMEPATLQYIQQGVMYELYRYIENHPYLGDRLPLRNQETNQYMALLGSRTGSHATIDLSAASDSVSWSLIQRVFRRTPQLYRWLLATRSRETLLPDGTRLRLNKFAPMGSALCFPMESLLFAAVVEHAFRRTQTQAKLSHPGRSFSETLDWCVYGDDIVLPTDCFEYTVCVLESLGFTVNETKSYSSGKYRESCGKEYYGGFDITPLYYRIPFCNGVTTPSVYGALCSGANNAHIHGLPLLRQCYIDRVLNFTRKGPYFTTTSEESPFRLEPPTDELSCESSLE